jgi:glycosyltransferase involved in cell wall biosynthesis
MRLSLLICSHNPRPEYLDRVLEALRRQTLPAPDWELLLIDNGSDEPLAPRWDLSWHPHGRHVRENELGLTPARWRGIRESSGDLLVFADDDNVLDENYLAAALDLAQLHPYLACFGGSSVPEYEVPPPAWANAHLPQFLALHTVVRDSWGNIRDGRVSPFGAGLAIRREIAWLYLEKSRRRETKLKLGRTGKRLFGYEDSEMVECARLAGFGSGRFLALRLTHLIPRSRLTLDYFLRHAEDDAFSHVFFREQNGLKSVEPPPSQLRRILWLLKSMARREPREIREIQRARWRGYARGIQAWKSAKTA